MFSNTKTGEQIAKLRKQKGLTQDELAEKLRISPQAVSKWENGHAMPEIALLTELAGILDCTTDVILFPARHFVHSGKYIHQLLPYQDVDPYTGEYWPRGMAFPAVMAALKLFMGQEERRNYNQHQINDDQEYILQSGISTLAFGFSHYNAEFIHDCFRIYGLDYHFYPAENKTAEEITSIIRKQIENGFPVIIQDKSNNAAFLFITGITSDGLTVRAHNFIEGMDENNFNMNPYDMKPMDNWFKPNMVLLQLFGIENKLNVGAACKNALSNYYRMMAGQWNKPEFVSQETPESFRQFMGYGSGAYTKYIQFLQENKSLEGFYPQQCILYESNLRVLGFLKMCKEYVSDIDRQSMNEAIDRYQVLKDHCWEIINISWNDPKHTETDAEKAQEIRDILIRCNEVFNDAVKAVRKAIGLQE